MLGQNRNANKILAGKPDERRRLLRRRMYRWQDNIKVTLKDIRCECLDSIHVAQHKHHWRDFVNAALKVKLQNRRGSSLTAERVSAVCMQLRY